MTLRSEFPGDLHLPAQFQGGLRSPGTGAPRSRATLASSISISFLLPFRIAIATEQVYSHAHVYRRGIGSGDSGIGGSLGCGHAPVARMCSPIRCRVRMGSPRRRVVRPLVVVANWARPGHRARESARGACPWYPARHRCRLEVGQIVICKSARPDPRGHPRDRSQVARRRHVLHRRPARTPVPRLPDCHESDDRRQCPPAPRTQLAPSRLARRHGQTRSRPVSRRSRPRAGRARPRPRSDPPARQDRRFRGSVSRRSEAPIARRRHGRPGRKLPGRQRRHRQRRRALPGHGSHRSRSARARRRPRRNPGRRHPRFRGSYPARSLRLRHRGRSPGRTSGRNTSPRNAGRGRRVRLTSPRNAGRGRRAKRGG